MKSVFSMVTAAFCLFLPLSLSAHGVVYQVEDGSAIVIRAGYDTGEPMSYAEVLIYAPGAYEVEYQNGRTDQHGVFSFLPDRRGKWKIKVNDGMGHGLVTDIEVQEEMGTKERIRGAVRPWQKALLGISLIGAITMTWLYLIERRKNLPKMRRKDEK